MGSLLAHSSCPSCKPSWELGTDDNHNHQHCMIVCRAPVTFLQTFGKVMERFFIPGLIVLGIICGGIAARTYNDDAGGWGTSLCARVAVACITLSSTFTWFRVHVLGEGLPAPATTMRVGWAA